MSLKEIIIPTDSQALMQCYEISAIPGLACQQNAFMALVKICAKESNLKPVDFPQIWQVDFGDDYHAYLLWGGKTYSAGITWPDNTYPELRAEEVREIGKDITYELIERMYWEMSAKISQRGGVSNGDLMKADPLDLFTLFQYISFNELPEAEGKKTLDRLMDYLDFF
jgi:hypothetical protein